MGGDLAIPMICGQEIGRLGLRKARSYGRIKDMTSDFIEPSY
jgi:hypothetical protein